jgi:hypothetical protein
MIDGPDMLAGSESSPFRDFPPDAGTAPGFIAFTMEAGGVVETGTTPSGMSFTATCG